MEEIQEKYIFLKRVARKAKKLSTDGFDNLTRKRDMAKFFNQCLDNLVQGKELKSMLSKVEKNED